MNTAVAVDATVDIHDAVRTYHQLMRHRIAHPLTVIAGMAHTLRDVDHIPDATRLRMLDAIIEQSGALYDVSIEPRSLTEAEQSLDPQVTNARHVSVA